MKDKKKEDKDGGTEGQRRYEFICRIYQILGIKDRGKDRRNKK